MIQDVHQIASGQFKPLEKMLLVKPVQLETEETTEGGILLKKNTSVIDRPTYGEVIAVGKGIDDIEVHEHVVWVSTAGVDLLLADGTFILLRYESLIGVKTN